MRRTRRLPSRASNSAANASISSSRTAWSSGGGCGRWRSIRSRRRAVLTTAPRGARSPWRSAGMAKGATPLVSLAVSPDPPRSSWQVSQNVARSSKGFRVRRTAEPRKTELKTRDTGGLVLQPAACRSFRLWRLATVRRANEPAPDRGALAPLARAFRLGRAAPPVGGASMGCCFFWTVHGVSDSRTHRRNARCGGQRRSRSRLTN